MDLKEKERFKKILINGYEDLIRSKPSSPEEHFIYYLLSHISPEVKNSDPTLKAFYDEYQHKLHTEAHDPNSLFGARSHYNKDSTFDYDLFILGTGIAAVSTALLAASHGLKVGIVDYTLPSEHGSTWEFGGSFINSGTIPKRLLSYSRLLNWDQDHPLEVDLELSKDWSASIAKISKAIREIALNAKLALAQHNVKHFNAIPKFVDHHIVELYDPKRSRYENTSAKNFLIALEGRPEFSKEVAPYKDLCHTLDDIWSLKNSPGKTLVIGETIHAVEAAGFLRQFGLTVALVAKENFLEEFDSDVSQKILKELEGRGVRVLQKHWIAGIDKLSNGKKRVLMRNMKNNFQINDTYDTVIYAGPRSVNLSNLELESTEVKIDASSNKVITNDRDQASENIFIIGEAANNRPSNLEVLIKAGNLVAKRLIKGNEDPLDYENLDKVIYGPVEGILHGYSEESAKRVLGNVADVHYYKLESSLLKVVGRKGAKQILGFCMLGNRAHEDSITLIQEIKRGIEKDSIRNFSGAKVLNADEFNSFKF